ncbi:MAG: P-loop NTPase [Phycisphaerae bacterium]
MTDPRRIAIASGKGGTGKTTVAVNLAAAVSAAGVGAAYLDCDVEEPNGALYLRPELTSQRPVYREVPSVDPARCNQCGLCGKICRFSAIVPLESSVMTFPELCHSCGACSYVCPTGAIREQSQPIGRIRRGQAGTIHFLDGLLDIGQAMAPPVIRAVRREPVDAEVVILDAPPGTSCPAVETLYGVDMVVLVAEPTPFSLHDLTLAVEMVRARSVPAAVVVNRADGDDSVLRYCRQEGLEILAEIPLSREAAEVGSRGQLLFEQIDGMAEIFQHLADRILLSASNSKSEV